MIHVEVIDSRSQGGEKAKSSVPIITHSFQMIWVEFGLLLRLVILMNLILIVILSI